MLGWPSPFSEDHTAPWTFCQLKSPESGLCKQDSGSTVWEETPLGFKMNVQAQCRDSSKCEESLVGEKGADSHHSLLETAKEGTFLKFLPQGVTDGSVCWWWCCCDTAHDETHWQVSQSTAVWAKTGFKSTAREKWWEKMGKKMKMWGFASFLLLLFSVLFSLPACTTVNFYYHIVISL